MGMRIAICRRFPPKGSDSCGGSDDTKGSLTMSELQRLDGPNLTAWMQLVLRSQVSGDNPESIAILAAHNEIVALQRKTAHADDTGVALEWGGEDPCWSAPAPGSRLAVVVTDDDEA